MPPRVVLLPKHARPFYGRHPWVYAGAVAAVEGGPADGDVVDLVSDAGLFVARGLYNSNSKIRVRLYTWSADVALDADFFEKQLLNATNLRLDTPEGAFADRGGKWAIVPGKPDSSLVVHKINDPDSPMPPETSGKSPSKQEIAW